MIWREAMGERTICERSEMEESAKLGIFGARSFDAAIDAAVTAIKLTVAIAAVWLKITAPAGPIAFTAT
jgi:hypothetical protein